MCASGINSEDCDRIDGLGESLLSNVSICTATNKILTSSYTKNNFNGQFNLNLEGGPPVVIEDFYENYPENYPSSSLFASTSSDDLGGSMYSDCGVPLRAAHK